MTPILFGLGSTELLRENPDSTKTWRMERDSYRMIIYAGDYIREEIPVESAGITVNFYYSRKHSMVSSISGAAGMTTTNAFSLISCLSSKVNGTSAPFA